MAVMGLVSAPMLHKYFQFLDKTFPGTTFKTTLKKLTFDQLIFAPLSLAGLKRGKIPFFFFFFFFSNLFFFSSDEHSHVPPQVSWEPHCGLITHRKSHLVSE
jgi:hypothetical protein